MKILNLIQPPNNEYWLRNIMCHGIKPRETINKPMFDDLFPAIKKRIFGRKIVAHNEAFDRNVLAKAMKYYGLYYDELELADR